MNTTLVRDRRKRISLMMENSSIPNSFSERMDLNLEGR
jgi:hypothetical protein